ncbi:hypothetical protein M422DRAFT_241556 [Sphaerobolus stellatus SS14]|nr:hypothetical protein M422DRAFT_241556 [Sphaerobolus stellatus SS14]
MDAAAPSTPAVHRLPSEPPARPDVQQRSQLATNGPSSASPPGRSSLPPPVAAALPPRPPTERQIEVRDALSYLDDVKKRFDDLPHVYNHFLDIMKDFKGQKLNTPMVIERVAKLFTGHPELISGFNAFLPLGYRIDTSASQRIWVTTPAGILTPNATGALTPQFPPGQFPPGHPMSSNVDPDTRSPSPTPRKQRPPSLAVEDPDNLRMKDRETTTPTEVSQRVPTPPPKSPSRPASPVQAPLPPIQSRSGSPHHTPPVSVMPVGSGKTQQIETGPPTPIPMPLEPVVVTPGPIPPPPPGGGIPVSTPVLIQTPSSGSGPIMGPGQSHPSHIPLPPLHHAIANIMQPAPGGGPLVLTPAVVLNSSQTTANAASLLGGMHRITSNPESIPQQQASSQPPPPPPPPPQLQSPLQQQPSRPTSQPVHPPASFHPSLPGPPPGPPPPPPPGPPPGLGTPMLQPMQISTPGGPLPGPGMQPQQQPQPPQPQQPEFYHAIQYINRIKTRFSDEPETYKQFLEILQTYQKEQRLLHDVYAQVTQLFRNAPELIDEFKMFLPDTGGAAVTPGMMNPNNFVGGSMLGPGGTVGVMGVVGQGGTPGVVPVPGTPQAAPANEWTMEVNNLGGKGDKSSGYRRKTAPGAAEMAKEGPPAKKRRKALEKDVKSEKERERESVPVPSGTAKIASRPRQAGSRAPEPGSPTFNQYGRPPTPINGAHIPPHAVIHAHPHPPLPPHPHTHAQPVLGPPQPAPMHRPPTPPVTAAPEIFFDHVRRTLDDREAWEEFLKLLTLYSSDVLDEHLLVQLAAPFLGGTGSELEMQFRELLGLEKEKSKKEKEKEKEFLHQRDKERTYATATGSYVHSSKFGPSYRRLPETEVTIACSGRDELARSVLNDEWVSHPVWASEDAGFVAHKKNTYEEALHKTEDERHEYHVYLESMTHTISLLEPIAYKIEQMSNEDRIAFRLSPDLGGRSRSIHEKIIKKVYGSYQNAQEVLQSLQESPAVAVPVVLHRLKQVDAEWRKSKREWDKVWRDVDARNFYKSLDHQGVAFKANDKKNFTGKAFLTEIERIKKTQDKERDGIVVDGDSEHAKPGFVRPAKVLPRHQLEYDLQDESVLQDAIKLTLCFLERNDQRQSGSTVPQYNTVERRRIEAFLRHYVLHQFGLGPEFDAAFGPPIDQAEWEDLGLYVALDEDPQDSDDENASRGKGGRKAGRKSHTASSAGNAISAGDLKKKLTKAKRNGTSRKTNDTSKGNSGTNTSTHRSPVSSRLGTPVPGSVPGSPRTNGARNSSAGKQKDKARDVHLDDVWLYHVDIKPLREATAGIDARADSMEFDGDNRPSLKTAAYKTKVFGSFFCNANFYTLIRLLQLLYSRLMYCKNLATTLAGEGSKGFSPNPVAYSLGLTDTAGPVAFLADLDAIASDPTTNPAQNFYIYLLDLVEKVFDCELEQHVFEENIRFMFGTRAYIMFTLDKLCAAICKQVQAVVQDNHCHELMHMFEQRRAREAAVRDLTAQEIIRYRRQAETLIGSDEYLFRVGWCPDTKKLRIQLLDVDDLSLDPPPTSKDAALTVNGVSGQESLNSRMTLRWKQYVQSYVLRYPTEGRRLDMGRKAFLKRTLLDEDSEELNQSVWVADSTGPGRGLQVMVSPVTYKLFFANGCEEALWRVRLPMQKSVDTEANPKRPRRGGRRGRRGSPDETDGEDEEENVSEWERLRERADARLRDQKRWMHLFDQGASMFS